MSAVPVPTTETLHEIHSEPEKGWHSIGTWNGKSYADQKSLKGSEADRRMPSKLGVLDRLMNVTREGKSKDVRIWMAAAAAELQMTYELEVDKIHRMMIKAGCACAVYCA